MGLLHNLLTLGRVSNLPTVWTNCTAAWAVNTFASPVLREIPKAAEDLAVLPWPQLGWLLLGASLLYMAGCTLNDAFDQEFDNRHNPQRPIPSGSMPAGGVWAAGLVEMGMAVFILMKLAGVVWIWLVALTAVILLYDAVHKKWAGSVWLMGSCRFFLWLTAASAANEKLAPLTLAWSGVVALYVVGISLFARGETTGGDGGNRLPIPLLFGAPLFALALLVYWNNLTPLPQLATNVAGLTVAWLAYTAIQRIRSGEQGCIGHGVSRLLAGIAACDATAAGLVSPTLAYACLACVPAALVMQKRIAAT